MGVRVGKAKSPKPEHDYLMTRSEYQDLVAELRVEIYERDVLFRELLRPPKNITLFIDSYSKLLGENWT